jgi:hypothetical protein
MKVLGYEIDLQRQIRAGDTLELFYGNPLTGSSTKRKVLHYARLHARPAVSTSITGSPTPRAHRLL